MAATLPPDMRAAYVTELGPPSNIEVGSLPLPVMGADEVLVRTEALGVDHVDTFIRSGAYATDMSLPFVVGRDLVGTVVDVGKDVGDFAPGQRVWCSRSAISTAATRASVASPSRTPRSPISTTPQR